MSQIAVIIPAGGVGKRMGGEIPKQYLELYDGKRVLEVTLSLFCASTQVSFGVVGIAKEDCYFDQIQMDQDFFQRYEAGESRASTVLNGLIYLENQLTDDDWVIVHDAARPGLKRDQLNQFIHDVTSDSSSVGGIMALPAVDTVKCVGEETISNTLERARIYLAQTPQMFRYGVLKSAYKTCFSQGLEITDEAFAVENLGYHPKIYQGDPQNFKITHSFDLKMMQWIMEEREACE